MKFKDVIAFLLFWFLFITSFPLFFIVFGVFVVSGMAGLVSTLLLMPIVFGAFFFAGLCFYIMLNKDKEKGATRITKEVFYKPIKLPEKPKRRKK